MSRKRALTVIVLALAVAAFGLAPAWAQTPTTTAPTTAPSTAPAPPTSGGSTTIVATSLPPLPPPPPTTAPINDTESAGDAPPAPVPKDDTTIPPRDDSSASGSVPPRGQVVELDVVRARAASDKAQLILAGATARRLGLETAIGHLQSELAKFDQASKQAVVDLANAKRQLATRAVDAYIRGSDVSVAAGGLDDEHLLESGLLRAVLDRDDVAIATFERVRRAATAAQMRIADALVKGQQVLGAARLAEAQAAQQAARARFGLAVTTAGGKLVIQGFVFPVAPPYVFNDTFGAPRLEGTDLAHWHQGIDIAAAEGTELYAAERGVITQISAGGLGGDGLWLRGESGVAYYYAHLSRYADVHEGQIVDGGDVVGYVGNTGLYSTGPHLHFEVHPGGGDAINPYPLLVAADPTHSNPGRSC